MLEKEIQIRNSLFSGGPIIKTIYEDDSQSLLTSNKSLKDVIKDQRKSGDMFEKEVKTKSYKMGSYVAKTRVWTFCADN